MGLSTVAGAALPVARLPTFTGSRGRAGSGGASNFASVRSLVYPGHFRGLHVWNSTGFGLGASKGCGAMSLATRCGGGGGSSSGGGGAGRALARTDGRLGRQLHLGLRRGNGHHLVGDFRDELIRKKHRDCDQKGCQSNLKEGTGQQSAQARLGLRQRVQTRTDGLLADEILPGLLDSGGRAPAGR